MRRSLGPTRRSPMSGRAEAEMRVWRGRGIGRRSIRSAAMGNFRTASRHGVAVVAAVVAVPVGGGAVARAVEPERGGGGSRGDVELEGDALVFAGGGIGRAARDLLQDLPARLELHEAER